MIKRCPFNNDNCTDECALYISPDDVNETVRNRLASIGLMNRDTGICSLKTGALSLNRFIFENTNVKR